jgi:hypothetical protein
MWPDEIVKIFIICNPTKEKKRFERLIPHLLSCGVPMDRIQLVSCAWGSELSTEQIFAMYDPYLPRKIPAFTFKSAGLTRGELSLGLNYAAIFQSCQALPADKSILIFESDTFLRTDFTARLQELLIDLKGKVWDFVSLGEGVGTRPKGAPASYYSETKAYAPPHRWVFRCTDSLLFRVNFLQKVATTFLPFKEIIDWELNFQLLVHNGKAWWADPPLAEQGTWYSRMSSTLPA